MSKKARYRSIETYLSREFLLSFATAFLFFFFIFFINQLLVLARDISLSAISLTDVVRILLYSVPIILSFTFPFATLSGSAMALGTLSSNREIIALRSSGIPFTRIFKPIILFGVLFSIGSFFINDVFLPLGTIEYRNLYRELLYKTPEMEMQPYSPVFIDDTMIVTRRAGDEQIQETIIMDTGSALENRRVITAKSGRISHSHWEGAYFQFSDIEGIKGRSQDSFEMYRAEEMDLYFPMETATFSMVSVSPSEMSFLDVYHEIAERRENIASRREADETRKQEIRETLAENDITPSQEEELRRELTALEDKQYVSRTLTFYEIELFRKLALPLGCLFLICIALPIAAMPLQYGKVIGFGIGVILSTLYWVLLFMGQSAGADTGLPPAVLMFGPNVMFASIGLVIFRVLRQR